MGRCSLVCLHTDYRSLLLSYDTSHYCWLSFSLSLTCFFTHKTTYPKEWNIFVVQDIYKRRRVVWNVYSLNCSVTAKQEDGSREYCFIAPGRLSFVLLKMVPAGGLKVSLGLDSGRDSFSYGQSRNHSRWTVCACKAFLCYNVVIKVGRAS